MTLMKLDKSCEYHSVSFHSYRLNTESITTRKESHKSVPSRLAIVPIILSYGVATEAIQVTAQRAYHYYHH